MNKEKIIRNAQKYVSQGKIKKAIEEYEKILKSSPNDLNTLNTVGDLYIQLGDNLKATEYFKKIAKKYTEEGFYSKAIAVYKKITRIRPNDIESLESLADLFSKNGLLADAKKTYADIGRIYLNQNSFAKAYGIYKKVAALSGDDPNIHLKLAELSLKLNQVENALESYLNAAKILLNNGDADKAFNAAKIALEIDPTNIILLKLLFKISIQRRDFEYITPILKRAYEQNSDNLEIKELLGHNYLFLGELEKAEELFDQIFQENNEKINIFFDFARAAITLEEYELAAKNLKKIITPAIKQKRVQQLLEFFETILDRDPENLEALIALAMLYKEREDFGNYIKTMEKYVKVALDRGKFKEGLSAVEELLNNNPTSEEYLKLHKKLFVKLFPDEPYVPPGAEELEGTKSFEFATHELGNTGIKKVKTIEDFLLEVDLLKEYGLLEKAKNKLRDKIESNPENVKLIEKLASLLDEEGNKKEAAELFLRISEIYEGQGDLDNSEKYKQMALEMSPSLETELVEKETIFAEDGTDMEEIELEELSEGEEFDIGKLENIGQVNEIEEIFEDDKRGTTEEISLDDLNIDNLKDVTSKEESVIELEQLGQTGEINLESFPLGEEDEMEIKSEIFEVTEEVKGGKDREKEEAKKKIKEEKKPKREKKRIAIGEETDVELKLEETLRSIGGLEDVLGSFKKGTKKKKEIKPMPEKVNKVEKIEEKKPQVKEKKKVEKKITEKLDEDILERLAETVGGELEFSFLESEESKKEEVKEKKGGIKESKKEVTELEKVEEKETIDTELKDGLEEVDFFLRIGLLPEAQESIENLIEKFGKHPEIEKRLLEVEKLSTGVRQTDDISTKKEEPSKKDVLIEEVSFNPIDNNKNVISEISPNEVNIEVFNSIGTSNIEEEIESNFDLMKGKERKKVKGENFVKEDIAPDTKELEIMNKKNTFIAKEESKEKLKEIHNIFSDIVQEAEKAFSELDEGGGEEVKDDGASFSTHYDLGIAYKEMSLLDDAVKEFQKAFSTVEKKNTSEDYRKVCHMLSTCFFEKGLHKSAIKWGEKGLNSKGGEPHEYIALKYDIARAYEEMGEFKKALELYSEIYEEDVSFMDVSTRIDNLKGKI